jgi:hypothetical protein
MLGVKLDNIPIVRPKTPSCLVVYADSSQIFHLY